MTFPSSEVPQNGMAAPAKYRFQSCRAHPENVTKRFHFDTKWVGGSHEMCVIGLE